MRLRHLGQLVVVLACTVVCVSCGQVYRPVVIPITITPPNPSNFHEVFAINSNVPFNPGTGMQVDVSGDTNAGVINIGLNPTHAAILPNNTRVFVASAGSVIGQSDVVTSFIPAFNASVGTGLSAGATISLPGQTASITATSESANLVTATLNAPLNNIGLGDVIVIAGAGVAGYNGTFALFSISGTTIQYVNSVTGLAPSLGGTASVPAQPVFVDSTQNNAIYVANYNSSSVAVINTSLNAVTNSALVGAHPVALAETPNGNKLYVANQGSNAVSSLNTVDMSQNAVTGFSGITPVWLVSRSDSQKVYVLTQGDGQLVTIDTATDTVVNTVPVGAGANFIFYDPHLNRLYVTNPSTSTVYVFSTTGGANDTPIQLSAISMTAGPHPPCPSGCSPSSVTALRDGSRFYVASYEIATSCPDSVVGSSSACFIPRLTVFDANSFAVRTALTLLSSPPFASNPTTHQFQYAVPPVASCAPAALYAPGTTRFRVFTTASVDSSRVYVSMCDAGAIAIVTTTTSSISPGGNTPDTLVTDLAAPFGAGSSSAGGEPPPQNPLFLLAGQ
jgi:YVTN family beta-propeller protein